MTNQSDTSSARVQTWLRSRMNEMQPQSFQKVMGLQNPTLAARLLGNQDIHDVLSGDLCRHLDRSAGAVPKMSHQEARICERLCWMSSKQMKRLDRALTIVLNRKTALLQTSSASMAEVLEWADVPGEIALVRQPPLASLGPIPPVAQFELKTLEPYANQLSPYLAGLLPKRLMMQRSLRLKDEDSPAQETLPKASKARAALIEGLAEIFALSQLKEPRHAAV